MSLRLLVLVLAGVPVFAGCSASGLDAKESFACKAPEGVTCLSLSGVYEASHRNALPGQQPRAPQDAPGGEPATSPSRAAPTDAGGSPAQGARRAALSSGMPLRSAPRVLRIWLAPYEDSDGDLHDQSHLYVTVDQGAWQIEHTRRAIQDRFAPIRVRAPVEPASATNGAPRGAAAEADPTSTAHGQGMLPGVPGRPATPLGGR